MEHPVAFLFGTVSLAFSFVDLSQVIPIEFADVIKSGTAVLGAMIWMLTAVFALLV